MVNYISLPILDELVRFTESDSEYEDSTKAMASGILNHYFQATTGYPVAPERDRNSNYPDSIILRVRRCLPGDRNVVDHILAEATRSADPSNHSLDRLETALEKSNTEFSRCWALLIHACTFHFFEYHRDLPKDSRLIPWGPPGQLTRNTFHARHDSATIDWMLNHMVQNHTPPQR